jgi:ABC-type sugar transport system ATPase subunit
MAIEARGISKSDGTVLAVDDVSLRVFPGEIVCLVGDNGAGKSSVIRVLSGAVEPDEGTIRISAAEVSLAGPYEARGAGVQTTDQDLALRPNLGATYNLVVGAEPRRTNWGWLSIRDDTAARRLAVSRLRELGLVLDDDRPVHLVSVGQRQSVAIARLASDDVKTVILDEPTAALGVEQTRNVLSLIRTLAACGAAVILISHDIETVLEMSDRVVVLRLGRVIQEGPTSELTPVRLVHLMAGLALDADRRTAEPGALESST